jgi:5-guanidino-2-oxopentanoate decarboxylase
VPGRLIRIDVDPVKLSDHYAAQLPLLGDARLALEALAAGVRPRSGWRSQSGPGAAHRARIHETSGATARACDRAIRALRAGLPADAVLFTDMTQIAYHGTFAFEVTSPACWHAPVGYGALGYALPAAIGAKIGAPERPIVALAGDFGLQFTLAELMTAVEARLSLPIVLWNNEALGQIRDDMGRAGIGPVGVIARNPDFLVLARACGAHAVRADAGSLGEALHVALEHSGPTLIECRSADFAS